MARSIGGGLTRIMGAHAAVDGDDMPRPVYPALDSNTILAWNFTGSSGAIANLGTAGSGANFVTIGSQVVRNVPGPANAGAGMYGVSANNGMWTAQGAGASLGSGSFTNEITLAVFVDVTVETTLSPGGYQRILMKGETGSAWSGNFVGASLEFNGSSLIGAVVSVAGLRLTTGAFGTTAYGWRPGFHMLAYTYNGTISRLYFDGVQVSTTTHGSASNIVLGTAGNEGPWNIGTNYSGVVTEGFRGVVYHARVENVVRDATWINSAWKAANGWV